MTAVSSSMIHIQQPVPRVKIQDQSDEDIYDDCHNSNSRDASNSSPTYHPENDLENLRNNQENSPQIEQNRQLQTSAFAMQNVLKVKTERETTSPESQNVFSTEKLMENTPTCDAEKPQDYNAISPDFRNDSRNSLPTPSPRYDLNSPENSDRPYSNPNSVRVEINVDDESCCSEDTVLSVGNEAPVAYNTPSETSQKSQGSSPGLSPSNQGLTSFKHIQTHLNAISQLSQNLNIAQPLLLRPNPIAPNPLMFLNQPHLLFQNPLLNQIDAKHTNIPPRVPQPNIPQNALSANSPSGLSFGHLNQFNIRQLKQNGVQSSSQDLRNSRPTDENRRLNIFHPQSPSSDDERRELILNQNCLKFSIDNILKADFGRRITDPLFKRKTSKARQSSLFSETPKTVPPKDFSNVKAVQKPSEPRPLDVRPPEPRVPEAEKTEKAGAIDLSKSDEGASSTPSVGSGSGDPMVWPAWVYCTRYSDRPSSGTAYPTECVDCPGPRTRRPKKPPGERSPAADEKRPRTAFSGPQLARLKHEFAENRYLTERRRQQLAAELGLAEAQIKIWFQNKRAKIKKASGQRNPLALQLMAQGLYNHSTVPLTREEEELQELQAREAREKQGR